MTDENKKGLPWGTIIPITLIIVLLGFFVYEASHEHENEAHSHDGGPLHTD